LLRHFFKWVILELPGDFVVKEESTKYFQDFPKIKLAHTEA
jgi:hypothetical protein